MIALFKFLWLFCSLGWCISAAFDGQNFLLKAVIAALYVIASEISRVVDEIDKLTEGEGETEDDS